MSSPPFPRDEDDEPYDPVKVGRRLVDRVEALREGFDAAPLASQNSADVASQALPMPPSLRTATIEAVRPLSNVLDASARLAADANAAAEALENLKHLLVRQLPDPPQAMLPRAPELYPEGGAPTPPLRPRPTMTVHDVPQVPMPLLPAIPLYAPRPERGNLDIRGFLAGFALSAAIGAVLYIYLWAG